MDAKLWTDPKEAARTLGEAVNSAPFQMLLDMLAQYEQRVLMEGIDDEKLTKDYLRGYVHAVRTLRSDMLAAQNTAQQEVAREAWEEERKKAKADGAAYMPQPGGMPGHGPGGMS